MRNKFTKAMTSILLSSTIIIPMSSSIVAEEPTQTATLSADTFINTYLSNQVVQNGVITYEPFRSVEDTNYTQIIQSESVYASMPDSFKAEINRRVTANTGMDYASLLTAAKDKQRAAEEAAQQNQAVQQPAESVQPTAEQSTINSDPSSQPAASDTTAQTTTEQPAQPSAPVSQQATGTQEQPTTEASANTVTSHPSAITVTRTATTAGGASVTATYSGDTFSEEVNLAASDVSKSDQSYSIDICFKKADGTELEPNAGKTVAIRITYPSLQGMSFEVMHTNDNRTSADISVSSVDASSASFTTGTFSVFTIQAKTTASATQTTNETVQTNTKAEPTTDKTESAQTGTSVDHSEKNVVSAVEKTEVAADNENKTTETTATPILAQVAKEQEDSITAQANAFITTYLTSSTGVIYESANASNYQYILNSGDAWNQLSVNVRRKINQILTNKIGKTYLKLLTEAKNFAGISPRTSTETKAVSYSVMLGTSLLGIISATRKKKETTAE